MSEPNVPIYEYQVLCEGGCKVCGGYFELRRPIDRPELTACPLCKKPVQRVISRSHTPRILKPTSVVDAKKAGFTVFRKREKGVYERE